MKLDKFSSSQNQNIPKNSKKENQSIESDDKNMHYEIFKDPEERYFLLHVADNFIDQIREQSKHYDSFVFFDRGARLFGHLIKERWQYRYPDDKIPKIYFVKIGREMGVPSYDPEAPISYEYPWENIFKRDWPDDPLPPASEIIERLKTNLHFKKLVKSLRKCFSYKNKSIFDHKNILLVDEFMASGGTLAYGKELFSKAFPTAKIEGAALVSRFANYPDNPSIIKPVSGWLIPATLGDPQYAGVKLPIFPSREDANQFFITPQRLSSFAEKIKKLEEEIDGLESKISKIPENKKFKAKEKSWGVDFVAHPLIEKDVALKEDLDKTKREYATVKRAIAYYNQARREIHSIATMPAI